MLGGAVVTTLAGREEGIEHGLIPADLVGNTCSIERTALHVPQHPANGAKVVVASAARRDFHRLQACHGRNRMSRERAKLHQPFVTAHDGFVEVLHDLGTGPESGTRDPTTNKLPQRVDIRRHAIALLCPTTGPREPVPARPPLSRGGRGQGALARSRSGGPYIRFRPRPSHGCPRLGRSRCPGRNCQIHRRARQRARAESIRIGRIFVVSVYSKLRMGVPSTPGSGVTPRPGPSGGVMRPSLRVGQSGAMRGLT